MNYCKWCGQEATHQFKITKEYCCSKYPQQCPEFKKKLSKAKLGKKRSKKSIEKQSKQMIGKKITPIYSEIEVYVECDYGCCNPAKYQFNNGKYCCEIDYRKCVGFIKNKTYTKKWSPAAEPISINENIFCSFGCGEIAKYKFKNGKYCCSEFSTQCQSLKRNFSDYEKEYLRKINKKPIEYWSKHYPLFSKIEKIKKTTGGEFLIQCKNNKCKKWFTPTYTQLYERIRNIEREEGGGDYFYCSNECKKECSIYGQHKYPKDFKPNYSREVQSELRQMRFELDNYTCQKCGKHQDELNITLQCHHIEGIRWEPLESADLDKVITLCKNCHKMVHKIEGCNYNDMKCES